MLFAPITFGTYNLGFGDNDFIINDQSTFKQNWIPWYSYLHGGGNPRDVTPDIAPFYIDVQTVDGLDGADISYESHPIANLSGEISGDVFRRGKTITLSGVIHGANLDALQIAANYLKAGFANVLIQPLVYANNIWDNTTVYIMCRLNQDLAISRTKPQSYNYEWPWTVGLRADDGRVRRTDNDEFYFYYEDPANGIET